MRVLVWQWGRFGGAPRFGAALARAIGALPDTAVLLSLVQRRRVVAQRRSAALRPAGNHLLRSGEFRTARRRRPVRGCAAWHGVSARCGRISRCARRPGMLDLLMAAALRRLRIPFVVLVHDADVHPGDGLPFQMRLQQALCRRAAAVGALTTHVGDRLRAQGLAGTPARPLLLLAHPPVAFDVPPRRRAGPTARCACSRSGGCCPTRGWICWPKRWPCSGHCPGLTVRVVGSGPPSATLDTLQRPAGRDRREPLGARRTRSVPCSAGPTHWCCRIARPARAASRRRRWRPGGACWRPGSAGWRSNWQGCRARSCASRTQKACWPACGVCWTLPRDAAFPPPADTQRSLARRCGVADAADRGPAAVAQVAA